MSQESNWPLRLWIRLWTVCFVGAFLFGAAHVGSAALDWFERARGPVVSVMASGEITIPSAIVEPHRRAHALRLCHQENVGCAVLAGSSEARKF